MTIKLTSSTLCIIDLQEKLSPLIDNSQSTVQNCIWMCMLSNKLGVPNLVAEQYPKGLGLTIPEIRKMTPASAIVEKTYFSAARDIVFLDKLAALNKNQIILCGIETHVCVLQTALDLARMDYQVFVIADATSSRHPNDKQMALSRMQHHGITVVTKEMVCFEWLEKSGTEIFREVSKEFLK